MTVATDYTSANLSTRGALDTIAAAEYLGVARATLKKWRATGGGPVYVRAGGSKILYIIGDLDEFLRTHRVAA